MILNKVNILEPFKDVLNDVVKVLPKITFFIIFIILAWLFLKIILFVVKKITVKAKIEELSTKISEAKIFGNSSFKIPLSKIILGLVKWVFILIFLMAGANIFGVDSVSNGISNFLAYLPKLLVAVAIFAGGIYLGTIVRKTIQTMFKSLEITGGNLVGNIAFYIITIFLSITALDQAGVDTSIIKNNLTLIIGSILLSFTIAFGLGSRDIVKKLLFGYYTRKNIEVGKTVEIDGVEGIVLAIDNICVTLKTNEGVVVYPIEKVIESKVILKS